MNESDIFMAALDRSSQEERAEFLSIVCADNPELRQRVETLLAAHSAAGSLLDHPVVEGIATQLLAGSTDRLAEGTHESRTLPCDGDIPLDFLEPSQAPDSLGRLGQYEVLERVGRGGMGIVLKARDTRLHRVVAVKVLAPQLASNPTARRRFLREAQAAAAVSHDHVVTIYAVDENEAAGRPALPYLVMEFIDGQSLQQKLDQQGGLPLNEILRIGRQIAAGLAAAHAQGLIHRDIKPSNILLQNGVQRVQITDFGLARAADDVSMTRTGEVTGTPQYMSPEQAQGQPVDARSDLFSLGSVLYAMCTGRSPFRAESTVASLRRVCDDSPRPIREVNSDIPDWLVAIIDRLLQKNPDDRFQTAAEAAELLEKHLAHLQDARSVPIPETNRPVSRGATGRTARATGSTARWLVAGLALFAVVGIFGVTEATGFTQLTATVIRIVTGEGTLVIEVDDPKVEVSLDGEEISITGAGLREIKLRPGQYQLQATKDGEPLQSEFVSITRGDRRIVRVTREDKATSSTSAVPSEEQSFVVLGPRGETVARVGTLADAVLRVSAGDTVEIRGNGPFVSDQITIRNALTIRAADGFRPVITDDVNRGPNAAGGATGIGAQSLLFATAPLLLEGIELQSRSGFADVVGGTAPVLAANCRFWNSSGMHGIWTNSDLVLKNCEVLVPESASLSLQFWSDSTNQRIQIENSVLVGHVNLDDSGHLDGSSLLLKNNTFFQPTADCSLLLLSRFNAASPGNGPAISVHAENNVFYSVTWQFCFLEAVEPDAENDATELQRIMRERIAWSGKQNLYRSGPTYLTVSRSAQPGLDVARTLPEWLQFWGSEAGSAEGNIRYAGGDIPTRALTAPEQLTPVDFRLRSDSAGFRAGADGNDPGADVDFVGPGTAYERWKQTPEYATWLEEVARLMSDATFGNIVTEPDAFVVLGGEKIAEQKFDTLAEAVLGSSWGDTIEIRSNGPFVTEPIIVPHPLTIRAGTGFQPRIQADLGQPYERIYTIFATLHPVVLEGLTLSNLGPRPAQFCDQIVSRAPLFIANCRIDTVENTGGVVSYADARVVNCMIVASAGSSNIGWRGDNSHHSLEVSNCILVGRTNASPAPPDNAGAAAAHFLRCTLVSPFTTALGIPVGPVDTAEDTPEIEDTWLHIEISQCLLDAERELMDVIYYEGMEVLFTPENVAAHLPRWLPHSGSHNLYNSGVDSLAVHRAPDAQRILTVDAASGLNGWTELWGNMEHGSQVGVLRYTAGNLREQARIREYVLQPIDFRLRSDSAGYQAGPNGENLGADVDLVGPGAAYERWKQTSEYATWLEDVTELMSTDGITRAEAAETVAPGETDKSDPPDGN